MLTLIKLELRKNKLSTYIWASFYAFVIGLGFCFLFGYVPKIEAGGGSPSDVAIFTQWSNFFMFISILFSVAFAVMSAVMHTKFTVLEYVGKRSVLLFSYPQSRGKILFAKCILVFLFTVIALVVTNTLAILIFALFSNAFSIIPNAFTPSMIPDLLSISVVCGLLSASVGLVAMRIGFLKKSLVATVVTSIILIAPFGNILAIFPQQAGAVHFIGMAVMLLIGILIFLGLISKVSKMEAV